MKLSADELAAAMGVHWVSVYNWARRGRIPYTMGTTRKGKRRRFDLAEVRRALADEPVSASVIAKRYAVRPETVLDWASRGWVPSVPWGKQRRFDPAAVEAALQRRRDAQEVADDGRKRCTACGHTLSVDQFLAVTYRRKKPTHNDWTGPSADCRRCRATKKREPRRRLDDVYVRDQLVRATGLAPGDIPDVMVEAKRAQLAIRRAVQRDGRKGHEQ